MSKYLKVMLWGKEIGRLAWHEGKKLAYFNYNPEFLQGNLDIAPIVASIHNPASTRTIFGEDERIYQKLPSFIADSLPDAWGNQLFEQWRKQNRLSAQKVTPLEKLAFIGKRGMGALEFVPEIDRGTSTDKINVKELADLAEKILSERKNVCIEADEELTLHSLISVGTSAGGRQPKGIIALNPRTNEIRSGQVDNNQEFEYYILKFGDKQRSTAELEFTYYEMGVKAGINMMHSELMMVDGTNHFLTRRFDRDDSGKLHTQTLAAISPDAHSYEELINVCRKLHLPELDCQEVFRRLVFNILANNTDDHNKNFTFIMDRKGQWRLSPAYDLTYIFDTGGFLPNKEHCMMIGGKLQEITLDDITSFAEECGITNYESIIRKVASAVSSFRELAVLNGVRDEWIGRVEYCLQQNLETFGFATKSPMLSFKTKGHVVTELRIEEAFKGNYHLLANIDGHECKYVIRIGTEDHQYISRKGLSNLQPIDFQELTTKYFLS